MPRKQMTTTEHITNAIAKLGYKHVTELADALGVSDSAVSKWIKLNQAPAWTVWAIDGLLGHKGAKTPITSILCRLVIQPDGDIRVSKLIPGNEMTLNGVEYLLVKKDWVSK